MNKPIFLKPAYARRSYLGGKLIAKLKGTEGEDTYFPEEWIMSVVRAKDPGRENIIEGLTEDYSGNFLKDIIEKNPEEILGKRHFEKYGSNPGVLLKLLDAAERLAVQVHPSKENAKKYFNSDYGKTECWHVLDTRKVNGENACVYIGFKEGITREKWMKLFDEQDVKGMLSCLHRFDVKTGDTFLISGGVPHAIGAGCLLAEIQEPTDFTICTERYALDGSERPDSKLHCGIGFEKMFDCFDYSGLSFEETKRLRCIDKTEVDKINDFELAEIIGYKDTPMFCMDELKVKTNYQIRTRETFSCMYVLHGNGSLAGENISAGSQVFFPANCENVEIKNTGVEQLRILWISGPKL